MTDFYSASCVKRMVEIVERNKAVVDRMVENLKSCNRKLKGINNGINIVNDKIDGKDKN